MSSRAAVALSSFLFVALFTIPVAAHEFATGGIKVSHPWVRATPGGAKVAAGYLTLTAAPGAADRLIGARSSVSARAELHTHIHEGDVMKMRAVDKVDVTDAKPVLFEPMGHHVMLVDLKQPLKVGDRVKLTLIFEKAGDLDIEAAVEPIGAKGPLGLEFQPLPDGSNPAGPASGKTAPAHDHGAKHKH